MNNKTILIVDDTESNIDILLELLEDYDLRVALDGESALETVNEADIDLILLDIVMPDMDGYEVCRRLKSDADTKDIPVIFITAKSDEDSIEKAYDIGGTDYVTKPFKPRELIARVKKELRLLDLQNELKLLASIDSMTKLYNRGYCSNVSEHMLELARRNERDFSVIMLDIDKFKNINDTYGHQAGDKVIISLAEQLIENQRASDIVCRYGGEEFVILLPDTTLEGAVILANKIKKDAEHSKIEISKEVSLKFTVSLGVSSVDVKNDKNIEVSLKRADDALYEAKENGRNKVVSHYL